MIFCNTNDHKLKGGSPHRETKILRSSNGHGSYLACWDEKGKGIRDRGTILTWPELVQKCWYLPSFALIFSAISLAPIFGPVHPSQNMCSVFFPSTISTLGERNLLHSCRFYRKEKEWKKVKNAYSRYTFTFYVHELQPHFIVSSIILISS